MSGQDYYQTPPGPPPSHQQAGTAQGHHFGSNNPFVSAQDQQNPWQDQQGHTPQTHSATGTAFGGLPHDQHYDQAPPGPPPGRADTFKEDDFVPAGERGEQREALEQFEMNKGSQSKEDREMEKLQRDFPSVDGSLIAALYSDAGSYGATKEMLEELAKGQ